MRRSIPDVVVGTEPVPGDPDAIYAYDPTLVTDAGVMPLRPGKEGRREEPAIVAAELAAAGCTVLPALEAPATAEGGDMFFLDDRTLLVGLSYRTNEAAVAQLRPRLAEQGVEIVTFDLSHFHGPGECLHLMSFISPLDADLAVVYLPMLPVRLVHLLEARGIAIVEVPEEEFPSLGPNVLALGPRRAITVDANPVTRSPARGRRGRGPDLPRRPRLSQRRRRAHVPHAGPRAGMIEPLGLPPHHVRRAVPTVPRRPDVGDVLPRARAA